MDTEQPQNISELRLKKPQFFFLQATQFGALGIPCNHDDDNEDDDGDDDYDNLDADDVDDMMPECGGVTGVVDAGGNCGINCAANLKLSHQHPPHQ